MATISKVVKVLDYHAPEGPTTARGNVSIIEPEGTPVSVGVLMFIPYRYETQRVLAVVNAAGHDISPAQARIFGRLDRDGSRLTDLARAAQVSKQAAGFLVNELERDGYLERVPDPEDGRARLIRVTPKGRDVIAVAMVETQRIEAEWEARLGADRFRELRRALEDLREITDL